MKKEPFESFGKHNYNQKEKYEELGEGPGEKQQKTLKGQNVESEESWGDSAEEETIATVAKEFEELHKNTENPKRGLPKEISSYTLSL